MLEKSTFTTLFKLSYYTGDKYVLCGQSIKQYIGCTGVIGHTAVYDSHSNALLIYGGLLLIDMKFIESDTLFSLNMHSMVWSLLHVTSSNTIVRE